MDVKSDLLASQEDCLQGDIVSTKEDADHIRVDGDGGLVPATNDEFIELKNMREEDKQKDSSCPELMEAPENLNVPEAKSECDVQIEQGVASSIPCEIGDVVHHPTNPVAKPKLSGASDENDSTNSSMGATLKPDFSLLQGEIHLDNLSVKDLQETFKATFGRETSVKDKQWLKRRIIMGLTNSCDFTISTLVMAENRMVKKVSKETFEGLDCSELVDCPVTCEIEKHETSASFYDERVEIHSTMDELPSSCLEGDCETKDKDVLAEQRPAKRVRRPTRRYIEEISEVEPEAKSFSSTRNCSLDRPLKVRVEPVQNIGLHDRSLIRKDSLGGFGVQIPHASRIRRSRPRENFATLMPIHAVLPLDSRKNDAIYEKDDDEGISEVNMGSLSNRRIANPPTEDPSEGENFFKEKPSYVEKIAKLKDSLTRQNASDDEDVIITSHKGGIRRKHHRPWTLTEVVKLVEGVAKYGSGRWSEIKRVSFASYSYRTSVDLKDKWRNLLKASLAESPRGNEIASKRQTSASIPTEILLRIKELAHTQLVGSPDIGSGKLSSGQDDVSRTVADEAQVGFL